MKLTAEREKLLVPLQAVIGVVERRQTMPVLANVLLGAGQDRLSITATDLEVELVATTDVGVQQGGDITVPGRKFLDILRALPEKTGITIALEGDKLVIRGGTQPLQLVDSACHGIPGHRGHQLAAERADNAQGFAASAGKDAFFDGTTGCSLLLERDAAGDRRADAAGGRHRRSPAGVVRGGLVAKAKSSQQVIVPRKGVLELQRILTDEGTAEIAIGTNHVRAQIGDVRFTSKLIDGRFPEYSRVIPAAAPTAIRADRDVLRQALQRTAILSNEKYRGIRVTVKKNMITVQAHNPEQEEAEEEIEVAYDGK